VKQKKSCHFWRDFRFSIHPRKFELQNRSISIDWLHSFLPI